MSCRVLLKRISHVLTAPPEITDKQYQDMKKLVIPKGKGNTSTTFEFYKVYANHYRN